MKRNRHGKGKILSQQEIQLLFSQGLTKLRDRCIFAVMLYSGCRVNEACTLLSEDVYERSGRVRSHLTIRKKNTKGKLATRTIPIIQELRAILSSYEKEAGVIYLFPGLRGKHITPDSAARILRKACHRVGIEGASTHSFRRTALTQMSDSGIPLRVIAEVSGHRDLGQLQAYLEVREEQVLGAVSSLSMLSFVEESSTEDEKERFPDSSPSLQQ
ncbi:MAG: site-specific integrase [Symploca sp. SIO2E9]|nr:site-specific integrase [Symploca sp. SIO2E9]